MLLLSLKEDEAEIIDDDGTDDSEEEEEEEEMDLSNSDVVTKYKMAADIANRTCEK